MCSILENEDVPTDVPFVGPSQSLEGLCFKCKLNPSVLITRRNASCESCFMVATEFRFRSAMAKSKKLKTGSAAIVALSSSPSSFMLMDLMAKFQRDDITVRKRQLKLSKMTVVHVDTSVIHPGNKDKMNAMRDLVASTGLDFLVVPLESLFEDSSLMKLDDMVYQKQGQVVFHSNTALDSNATPVERLQIFLNGLGKLTAKEDALKRLIHQALLLTAEKLSCETLFTAETCTRLAIRSITDIAQGRGLALPTTVAMETDWSPNLIQVRPLFDIMRDEVDAFNRFLNIQTVQMNRTFESPQRSIERLTTDFLVGLNTDFPSTIPAVTKTAQKISPKNSQASVRCALCDGPRDDLDVDWRRKHTLFDLPTAEGEPSPDAFIKDASFIRINESLCYPCQNLTQDVKDETGLQVAKGADVQWTMPSFMKVSREKMEQDISSFLL